MREKRRHWSYLRCTFFSSSNFYTIRQIHFEKNSQSCKAIEQTVPETNAKKKSPWDRICSQYIEWTQQWQGYFTTTHLLGRGGGKHLKRRHTQPVTREPMATWLRVRGRTPGRSRGGLGGEEGSGEIERAFSSHKNYVRKFASITPMDTPPQDKG